MCYHIIRWHDSVRATPAIKRCYRAMSTAQTIRKRGIMGDRSDAHLDPSLDLAVVKCREGSTCECARWPQGHNADTIPAKPKRKVLMCEKCEKARRGLVEVVDPDTEEPALYCEPCYRKFAADHKRVKELLHVRRVRADDPAFEYVAVVA